MELNIIISLVTGGLGCLVFYIYNEIDTQYPSFQLSLANACLSLLCGIVVFLLTCLICEFWQVAIFIAGIVISFVIISLFVRLYKKRRS
jgi:uncharacterized membrane protein YesL